MGMFSGFSKKVTITPPPTIMKMVGMAPPPKENRDTSDEPTFFTTFMVFYYGFFGLTLLFYPYLFAADACPWNPMAYWTTISDPMAFTFRIAGAGFLTIVLGPFLDEIFGGVGVIMKAFTKQLMIANLCTFFVFLYYTFYSPLPTAVSLIWQGQTAFAGLVFGWNIMEANEDDSLMGLYMGFTAMFFGFFSLGLATVPDFMFGPPSPMAYWNTWGEWGMLTARSLGLTMFVLVLMGYYYFSKVGGLCKAFTFLNVCYFGLFFIPSFFGGASAISSMWMIQLCVQIPIMLVGIYLEITGTTGPWGFVAPSCPGFLTHETFCTVNLAFIAPFAIGFGSPYSNLLFGPATPAPIAMFTVDIDETGLWFCKAWAITTLTLSILPFVFGLSFIKVTKMISLNYLFTTALFVFAILKYEIFNVMAMAPLTGLNVLFFAWGLYLSIPAKAGEPML